MSESAAPSQLSAVRDFPDRLPAMLVKELRQGLRARLFGETIAGFHLVILVLMLPLSGLGGHREALGIQRLVWWIFAGVLVLVLPLRGLSALMAERRGNTLDTLILTNLKAGRIVRGKWLAIACQVCLTGLSVLPYILILYAGGGISLPASVLVLLRLILAGLVLTAAFLGLSWNQSWLHRAAPGLALAVVAMNFYAWPLVAGLTNGRNPDDLLWAPWRLTAEILTAGAAITILLGMASQRLAPEVENHQSGPRLVALLLPWLALAVPDPLLAQAALAALTLVSLSALTEPWPTASAPGRGWQRGLGWAAGWPHGVVWAAGAWGLALGAFALQADHDFLEVALRLAAWLACGRLLLWCGPAGWSRSPWALTATALLLAICQGGILLAGQMSGQAASSTALAAMIPSPLPLIPVPGSHAAMGWIAAVTGAACLLRAGIALAEQRRLEKFFAA